MQLKNRQDMDPSKVPLPGLTFHLNTIVILQVKEIMQKAFWDLLEQQLEADPPQYTQVVKDFFSGVKDWFHFLWSGSHSPHRDQGNAL